MNAANIGKSKKANPAPASEGPIDALGVALTAEKVPMFQTAKRIGEIVEKLHEAQRMLDAIATAPGAKLLRAEHLRCEKRGGVDHHYSPDIKNAIAELTHWKPFASVCPGCRENAGRKPGCAACKGLPYTTEAAFSRCGEKQRQAVQAMAK